ncbi:type II toxin-antitoxin system VapC family toxin [Desulforudis sp. 1088]|uniref:type II toxin-antitoxin system VapC family toxin n=1 Tax=unclassified Candidatus Desulforudis TaxID=2635950 RepID=UPI003CE45800
MGYLVDTCVFIDHLTGRLPAPTQDMLEQQLGSGDLCTSVIVYHELLTGAQSAGARGAVEQLLAHWEVVPVDVAVAAEAAELHRRWKAQGRTIAMADALIAATARVRNLKVLTSNTKDFPDVVAVNPSDL